MWHWQEELLDALACRRVQDCLDQALKANGVDEVLVGVNCEIGKHRSVAFVEELGRVRFKGWNVVVMFI